MLFISRSMNLWRATYIYSLCSIDKLSFPSISIFIAQYLLLFLKSSRSSVFLLPSTLPSVLQWHHEGGNFFSEYCQSNWRFYIGYYLEVSSSLLYVQELIDYLLYLLILSSLFSSSTRFQNSPNISTPIFLVFMYTNKLISQCNTFFQRCIRPCGLLLTPDF